jgi:hypothetical protein
MAKIKILSPLPLTGRKGERVTLYKNTKGLYVAILNGVEVGVAKEVETEGDEVRLPSCMDASILKDFKNRRIFFVETSL